MTSVLTAEAAAMLTTTDTFDQAINLAPDTFIVNNVRRFGFEFEMFPKVSEYDECYCDDECYCNSGDDDDTRAGINSLVGRFRSASLLPSYDYSLHSYHCDCGDCEPTRSGPFLAAQEDCTVGVEFVSRICDLGNPDDLWRLDLAEMVDGYTQHMRRGGWMPNGYATCGNHVHVSNAGDRIKWAQSTRDAAAAHIRALYAVFDWDTIIDGGCGRVRDYNAKPHTDGGWGGWLADKGYGTFEHRQWNTPRQPERLWAHIGLSIAITRWAFGIALHAPSLNLWQTRDYRRLMPTEHVERLTDARQQIVDVIRGYLPDGDEFDGARNLIGALRTY